MAAYVRLTIHSSFNVAESVKPSREEVEAAFRTIIRWAGDNPDRPGLLETPSRAARAFEEYFGGYNQDPHQILNKTFDETGGYEEMVILRGISFESHCEHHLAPIIGKAWVAYVPNGRVVGNSGRCTGNTATAGRRSSDRGDASLHVEPRSPQRGLRHGDQLFAGMLPRQRHYSPGISGDGAKMNGAWVPMFLMSGQMRSVRELSLWRLFSGIDTRTKWFDLIYSVDLGRSKIGTTMVALDEPRGDAKSVAASMAVCISEIASSKDETSFETLFRYFAPRLKSYFMRLGADVSTAEEVTQETWCRFGAMPVNMIGRKLLPRPGFSPSLEI